MADDLRTNGRHLKPDAKDAGTAVFAMGLQTLLSTGEAERRRS